MCFFVGRLLAELGLRSVGGPGEIPERWQPFVDGFLRQRDQALRAAGREGIPLWQMFKPACLLSETHVVVVEKVGGNRAQFGRTLRATNELIDGGLAGLTGVGIIPDADIQAGSVPAECAGRLAFRRIGAPPNDQEIILGPPNTGIFVLPGNGDPGGLEEVLLECANTVYPGLAGSAATFVNSVDTDSQEFTPEDMQEMRTPQGPVKARIGAISSVLKPGSTIQASILRDRWICAATMAIPRIDSLAQISAKSLRIELTLNQRMNSGRLPAAKRPSQRPQTPAERNSPIDGPSLLLKRSCRSESPITDRVLYFPRIAEFRFSSTIDSKGRTADPGSRPAVRRWRRPLPAL